MGAKKRYIFTWIISVLVNYGINLLEFYSHDIYHFWLKENADNV
jgi:hypothetical protein